MNTETKRSVAKSIEDLLNRAPRWPRRRLFPAHTNTDPAMLDIEDIERLATSVWWATIESLIAKTLKVHDLINTVPSRNDYNQAEDWVRDVLDSIQFDLMQESHPENQ